MTCARNVAAVVLAAGLLAGCSGPSVTGGGELHHRSPLSVDSGSADLGSVGQPGADTASIPSAVNAATQVPTVVPAATTAASPAASPAANPTTASNSPSAIPRPDHVVIVVFENKDRSEVDGSADAPYLSSLAKAGASFSDSHGLLHPSQGNYVALLAGSTLGVTDDSCPQDLGDKPNLVRQLIDKQISVTGYFEAMPSAGFKGCSSGRYARKHNPFADFSNIPDSANVPFSEFPSDPSKLPTVSFVVPDMCNDMHDCSVDTGDTWMKNNLSKYADWAMTHNSLLIVTFDEDNGSNANLIPTFFYGQHVAPGPKTQRIDHYNVLRTIQDMYGLAPLANTASAQPIMAWQN